MTYKKLNTERKKAISENANEYAKKNYKDISLKVKIEIAENFNAICKKENVSKAEMFRRMLDFYINQQK